MPEKRSPGLAGGCDAQCVLCPAGAAVLLNGFFAASSGEQPDADEDFRISELISDNRAGSKLKRELIPTICNHFGPYHGLSQDLSKDETRVNFSLPTVQSVSE